MGSGPYFHGYFVVANTQGCYFCGSDFGLACAAAGTCSVMEDDCLPCRAQTPPAPQFLMQARPFCMEAVQDTCVGKVPPAWQPIVQADPFEECGDVSCAGFYCQRGGPQNSQCFEIIDRPASAVLCAGDATSTPKDAVNRRKPCASSHWVASPTRCRWLYARRL
ncbi:MAG: hypothetical protein R3C68_15400 [Myxococcota bacterium]